MNKLLTAFIIYSFSFAFSFAGLAQDHAEVPHNKPLVILFDYDGTLAALATGQKTQTPAGKRLLNFNEELIQLGTLAQRQGALCLGFTNWFSANYASVGGITYDNCAGRNRITTECSNRGLKLNQVIVTHSFLYAFKKLSIEAETRGISLRNKANPEGVSLEDFVKSLSLDERLAILGSYYSEVIEKQEKAHSYDKGSMGSRKNHAQISEAVEKEERVLNSEYLEQAIFHGLGDPRRLLGVEQLAPGEKGMDKFQQLEIVLLLLPEFQIVVFDDKAEVGDTCKAAVKIDKRDVIGQVVLFTQQGDIVEENVSQWYAALGLTNAKDDCRKEATKYKNEETRLNELAKSNIEKLNQQTESSIKILTDLKVKFTGLIYDTSVETEIKAAIDKYINALQQVNTLGGTGACKYMVEATNGLLNLMDKYKDIVINKCRWSEESYEKFKERRKTVAKDQIKTNPIHEGVPEHYINGFLSSLGF